MANISLTANDLLMTARKIEDASDRIDAALQKLDVIMSDLDSVWSDKNAKTYLARYEELKAEFPQFKSAVRSYGTFLNSVVETYEKEYNQNIAARVNKVY
jgi:uncharacterized protein YukE